MFRLQNGFFTETKNNPSSIAIYIDGMMGKTITEFHDADDQCMKAVIDSFEMVDARKAVFHMKDPDLFAVQLISPKIEVTEYNAGFLLAKCALVSILKRLHEERCITNDRTIFQAYQIGPYQDGDSYDFDTGPRFIPINLTSEESKKTNINNEFLTNFTISTTHAYLSARQVVISFNKINSRQEENISTVLRQLFKEKEQPECRISLK